MGPCCDGVDGASAGQLSEVESCTASSNGDGAFVSLVKMFASDALCEFCNGVITDSRKSLESMGS